MSQRRVPIRRPDFDLSHAPRYWNGGDPFRTHFMNALSSVFPDGEAFFVRAVLHYRDRIDAPELLEAIRGFAGQEGQHSRQHDQHVQMLVRQGYGSIARSNEVMRKVLVWSNRKTPLFSLASTAALEHLTALLARQLLTRPAVWTDDMDPRMRPLWQWHALEEAEHKAVAYDVFQKVSPGSGLRAVAQVTNTLGLVFETWLRMAYMLHVDGLLLRPRLWIDGIRWLLGPGGALRGTGREYLRWYRRDFHPNQTDDTPLIELFSQQVEA